MFKICIVFKISIRRDGGSPCRKRKKEESSAATGSFSGFVCGEIARTRLMHRHSTADNYATALRSFLAFHGKKDISFAEVDSRLVDAYGEWLRKKGICKDTLSCYMRSLRAVYNKAVEQGLTEQKEPFVNVFTGISRTRKRSIEKADINKLRAVQVKPGSFMQLVRDVFLFCFYACGMPFVDVAFLKKSQIKGGMLVYHRRKTDQVVQIKLEPCMQEIVSRYNVSESPYLLPIIVRPGMDERKQYINASHRINRYLKAIGKELGLSVPLTHYVARHSWASAARSKNIPISVISESMGHDSENTTRIYLASLDTTTIDKANSLILKSLCRE